MAFQPPSASRRQLTGVPFETAVNFAPDAKRRYDQFDREFRWDIPATFNFATDEYAYGACAADRTALLDAGDSSAGGRAEARRHRRRHRGPPG